MTSSPVITNKRLLSQMGYISKNISDIISIILNEIVGKIHLTAFKSLAPVLFTSEGIIHAASSLVYSHSMYLSHLLTRSLCKKWITRCQLSFHLLSLRS